MNNKIDANENVNGDALKHDEAQQPAADAAEKGGESTTAEQPEAAGTAQPEETTAAGGEGEGGWFKPLLHGKGVDRDSRARLKEIISILNKHEIVRGLSPEKLRLILTDLGPTFIKLGQVMSTRYDMIPKAYCDELAKLCEDVRPMGMDEVRRVIENSLGAPLEELFKSFNEKPIGAASIAQAHRAVLPDGQDVVVKVQREGIHDTMEQDIALLHHASGLLKLGTGDIVDFDMVLNEMWVVAQEEMNFLTEAANYEKFRELNADVKFVTCPVVYRHLTTPHVLVMEFIGGYSMSDFDGLKAAGYDLDEIGRKLADNYIKQITEDGFFHADPHMGNMKVRDGKIVFIDMGMMGHLSARDQAMFSKGISAVAKHDIEGLENVILAMGKCEGHVDRMKLQSDIEDMLARYGDADLGGIDLAQVMNEGMDIAKAHKISMPSGVTMLARGLGTIEGVVASLAPNVDVVSITAARVSSSMLAGMDYEKEARRIAGELADSGRKALDLPALIADALRQGTKGQTRLNVEASASNDMNNRLGDMLFSFMAAMVACALFIAGGIMTLNAQSPGLSGMPVSAICAFVLALAVCAWLTVKHIKAKK